MKLKPPPGVGDPCVAGVVIKACDDAYEVEPEIGALLIECFGFVEVEVGAPAKERAKPAPIARRGRPQARKA
jgi:hypothetical protein